MANEEIVDKFVSALKKMKDENVRVEKKRIGLVEDVWIRGARREKKVKAKIDTGASKSSISKELLLDIGAPKEVGKVLVTSAMSKEERPVVELLVSMETGKWVKSMFTVAERGSMQYPLLIGKNTLLKMNVIVDPGKGI